MPRLLIRISRFYLMFSAVSLRNTDSTGAVLIGDLLIRVTTRQRFSATFDVSALPFVCECWIYGLVPNWSEPLSSKCYSFSIMWHTMLSCCKLHRS